MAGTGLRTLDRDAAPSGPDLHRHRLQSVSAELIESSQKPTLETWGSGYKTTFEMPSCQLRVAIFTLLLHVYVQLAHKLVCVVYTGPSGDLWTPIQGCEHMLYM